jgi:hypothetical protein
MMIPVWCFLFREEKDFLDQFLDKNLEAPGFTLDERLDKYR